MAGLMAGLGAYGGGALGGAIQGLGANTLATGVELAGDTALTTANVGADVAANAATTGTTAANAVGTTAANASRAATTGLIDIGEAGLIDPSVLAGGTNAAGAGLTSLPADFVSGITGVNPGPLARLGGRFADSAGRDGIASAIGRKTAARVAGAGLALPLLMPGEYKPPNIEDTTPPYEGPYRLAPRSVSYPTQDGSIPKGEHMYFDPSISKRLNNSEYEAQRRGEEESPYAPRPFNRGGGVHLAPGSFVADARTVSELGNGSGDYGKAFLARYGGQPVDGPGDGVSDSVRANIGGRQEARLSNGEVVLPPSAVERLGGSKALYALMDKAKAARSAERGSDTKLRAGLGAL